MRLMLQRVGSKGPAAEVARALVARITPSLLPPELLHAAMDQAADSQEGEKSGWEFCLSRLDAWRSHA